MPQPHGAEYFGFKRSLDLLKDGIGGLVRVDMDYVTCAAKFVEAQDRVGDSLVRIQPAMCSLHRVVVALPQWLVVEIAEALAKRRLAEQVIDRAAASAVPACAEAADKYRIGNVHMDERWSSTTEGFEDLIQVRGLLDSARVAIDQEAITAIWLGQTGLKQMVYHFVGNKATGRQ